MTEDSKLPSGEPFTSVFGVFNLTEEDDCKRYRELALRRLRSEGRVPHKFKHAKRKDTP